MYVRLNQSFLCSAIVVAWWSCSSPVLAGPLASPAGSGSAPKPTGNKPVRNSDDGKVKIDPELQQRIDELLKDSRGNKPVKVPTRRVPRKGRTPVRPTGAKAGATRPSQGTPRTPVRAPTRNVPRERNVPRSQAPAQAKSTGETTSGPTTSINIPPSDDNIAPEERSYRFAIKDGTYEQLVEGFARQTGLGVVGDAPRDGRVTFVTTEELSFNAALSRVRMLLFNYKPHEPYWIERQEMNLRVIRVTDIYRILPRDRMFQSVEDLKAAGLPPDELALVIFTPKSGSVAGLKEVRDFMPDYVRVAPLEGQNRVTIFALKKDIDKYLGLIDFFAGRSSDPRSMEKIPVHNMLPSAAIERLRELIDLDGGRNKGRSSVVTRGASRDVNALEVLPEPEITIIPEDPQQYILVRAMAPKIEEIKEILPWIDVKAPLLSDEPVVITVAHAVPEDLVVTIQQILSSVQSSRGTSTSGIKKNTRSKPRGKSKPTITRMDNVTIFAHPTLKAVVVMGEPTSVDRVRELVAMFDVESQLEPQRLAVEHADADDLITTITAIMGVPVKGKPPTTTFRLTADPSGDAIWFTGTEKELGRVKAMLATLDVVGAKPALRVVTLENALPSFVASILMQYGKETASARPAPKGRKPVGRGVKRDTVVAKFTAEDNTQRLFILCSDDEWADYEPLIRQLDSITDDGPLYERLELTYLSGPEAMAKLAPMVGDVIGTTGGVRWAAVDGAILLMDASPEQVVELRAYLAEVDKPSALIQRTFELRYAKPSDIKTAIEALVGTSPKTARPRVGRAGADGKSGVIVPVITEELTIVQIDNRLVVRATSREMERIAALIKEFDVDADETELRIYSDFPPGTDIPALAETLRTVLTSGRPISKRKQPPGVAGGIKDARFIPQPASHQMVVIAQTPEFEQIEELLTVLRGDVEIDPVEVAYVPVRYADPEEVIAGVEPLLALQVQQWVASGELSESPGASGASGVAKPGGKRKIQKSHYAERYYFVPDGRNHRVVIAAPAKIIAFAKGLIAEFDTPVDEDTTFQTVELKNADAASMVKSITELMGGGVRRRGGARKGASAATSAMTTPTLSIAEAPGGGAVVLHGTKKEVEQTIEWIEHLDQMSSRGREIKVFSIEYADLKRLIDLVMSVVDTPDPQAPPIRNAHTPRRKISDDDDGEDFLATKTYNGSSVYIQADFVAHTMLVATSETRMAEVESIVERFNRAPDPDDPDSGLGMSASDIPMFVYDLKYRDAFEASWELDSLLSQVWEPSDEVPKVESALFGDSLIIKYPDETRFDEIRTLITSYVDKLSPEDARVVTSSFPVPAGLSAKELAELLQAKHSDYQIVIKDITEKPKDLGLERLRPFSKPKSHPCVIPLVMATALSDLVATAEGGPVASKKKGGAGAHASPKDSARRKPSPKERPRDFLEEQLSKNPPVSSRKKERSPVPQGEIQTDREKPKAPKGEKLDVYYDSERGVLVVEGASIVVSELPDWIEEIQEGTKDFPVKPDIRIYRVRYVDVHTAKDILEEMFNATKQQRQMVQQQQRAAQQRARQQQLQQRQQQQQQKGKQGKQGPRQPAQGQQPQVPQLPTATVRIYPNERDRALIIRAETSQFPIIEELLATIDRPKPIDSQLKTFQLKRLNATDVEQLLTRILGLDSPVKTKGARRNTRRGGQAPSSGPGSQLPQTIMEDIAGGTGQLGVDPNDISISANEQTNSIVVMAPKAAIDFVGKLIKQLDNDDIPERVAKYYELKHAGAEELAEYLTLQFAEAEGGGRTSPRGRGGKSSATGGGSLNTPSFTPYARLNLLTVQATKDQLVEIDDVVARFDTAGEEMNWEDVTLTRGDAKQIAETLSTLYGETGSSGRGGKPGTGEARTARFHGEEGGRVLFMSVSPAMREQVLKTVRRLEAEQEDKTKLRFVTLKFASASKVADAITDALGESRGGRGRGATTERFTITAADGLKRLFVRADDETFAEIESLAKTLDSPASIGFEFRVFQLQYADAKKVHAQLTKLVTDYLRRLGSAANDMEAFSVEVDERANALVVLGSPGIFGFLEENIPKFDTPANAMSPPGFLMVSLKTANAQEVVQNINSLWSSRTLPEGENPPAAEANRSTNTLIVRGTQAQVDEIKKLFVDPLEAQTEVETVIRIYPVKFADPNGVVSIINQWARSRTSGGGNAAVVSGEVITAVAEQATQSVVVSASEKNHAVIRELIEGLDDDTLALGQRKREVIRLTYANASEIADKLTQVFRNAGVHRRGDSGPAFVGDAKTNTVIAFANSDELIEIKELLSAIDVEPELGTERTTEVYPLRYADPGALNSVVLNMFRWDRRSQPSPSETVTSAVEWATQSLVVTASAKNHKIVRRLVEQTDVESTMSKELRTYKLDHANAEDVAKSLQGVYRGRRSTRRGEQPVTITPDPATNALLVSANEAEHAEIDTLINELDVEPDIATKQKVHVVQLDNADADDVSRTLNEIFVRNAPRRGTQGPAISISAVKNAKAILVKCEARDYEEIAAVVAELDQDGAMVGGETRLVTLLYGDAAEVHKALQESLMKTGGGRGKELVGDVRLSALPQSNAILVTGTKSEVDRIEAQLREMDEAGEQGAVPQVIVLQHTKVGQVLPSLQELFSEQRRGGRRNEQPPVITANEPNTLIVRASSKDFSAIRSVVAELDTPERADKPNYRIIQVAQGINVRDLADKVELSVNDGAMAQAPSGSGSGRGARTKIPSITVTPDTRTNSLIVSGSPALFDAASELTAAMEKLGPSGGRATRVIRLTKLRMDEIQPLIDQLTGIRSGGRGRSSGRSLSGGNRGGRRSASRGGRSSAGRGGRSSANRSRRNTGNRSGRSSGNRSRNRSGSSRPRGR